MRHRQFNKYEYDSFYNRISTKTQKYKDFLEKGIRLSKTSVFYYYNGRFYRNIPGNRRVFLLYKSTQWEQNVKLRFKEEGINLYFSEKTIKSVERLKRFDLFIMD